MAHIYIHTHTPTHGHIMVSHTWHQHPWERFMMTHNNVEEVEHAQANTTAAVVGEPICDKHTGSTSQLPRVQLLMNKWEKINVGKQNTFGLSQVELS